MALYTWLIALYTMFSSIYHVHCSIYMVHCSIYHVFLEKNEFAKLCITSGFELTISCRPPGSANHCTTSVDTGVCLCTVSVCLILHCGEYVTWRLVSDIRRGARRATRSGHDVAGPGLHLDRSDARLRRAACRCSRNVPLDCGAVEKQAAAGEHAGRRAVRAHEACHTAVRVSAARCAGRLGNRYWRHDSECKGRQQECPNNGHHCISCHLRWFCWFARATACLIQRCTQFIAVHGSVSPERPRYVF